MASVEKSEHGTPTAALLLHTLCFIVSRTQVYRIISEQCRDLSRFWKRYHNFRVISSVPNRLARVLS